VDSAARWADARGSPVVSATVAARGEVMAMAMEVARAFCALQLTAAGVVAAVMLVAAEARRVPCVLQARRVSER
jgi:hypothetical protein